MLCTTLADEKNEKICYVHFIVLISHNYYKEHAYYKS
jgi:hypothetical protein